MNRRPRFEIGEAAIVLPAEPHASLIERLTTPRRVFLALLIIVFVTFAAQVREVAQREDAFYKGGDVPVGADFFVFYSAGQIVADGDGERLYDLERQQSEQARTLGTDDFDGFLPFAYPAFVAAPYALLSQIPFLWAYAINTVLLLAATGAVAWRLRACSPTAQNWPALVAVAMFASHPLTATNFGGLAVAFSLLCLAGCYAALRGGHEATAGVWLGLLLYKPQLAAPLLLLLLWRRQWRVAGVAGLVGIALALVGVAVAGPSWPRNFLDLARGEFYTNEARESGARMISLLGVAEEIFGSKSTSSYLIAGLVGAGILALLSLTWRGAKPDGPQFPLQFGLAIAATLLISPHALFYEASLLIIPIIFLVDSWRGNGSVTPHLSAGFETRRSMTENPSGVEASLSPGGASRVVARVFRPGQRADNEAQQTPGLTPNQRLILVCLFALGFLWFLGPLIGFQPLAALPVIVAVLIFRELAPWQRLGSQAAGWRIPIGVFWGESPNAPSGKRS